jgi:hypothetical protein
LGYAQFQYDAASDTFTAKKIPGDTETMAAVFELSASRSQSDPRARQALVAASRRPGRPQLKPSIQLRTWSGVLQYNRASVMSALNKAAS